MTVVPANQAGTGEFGVVLVVDASNSMKGTAIVRAMEAARAFATHRQSSQMMAVITFNDETNVVVALTADGEAIARGVADVPPLARGTHIYDAVEKAVALIEAGDRPSAPSSCSPTVPTPEASRRSRTQPREPVTRVCASSRLVFSRAPSTPVRCASSPAQPAATTPRRERLMT